MDTPFPSLNYPFRDMCRSLFTSFRFTILYYPLYLLLRLLRTERILKSSVNPKPSIVSCAVKAGDILAKENVPQERLYLVMEGELEVSKGGTEIATVAAGEFAGEVSRKS